MDSVAENIFTKKILEHSNKRLAFFVRDIIEGAARFGFIRDRLLDWMSCRSCVAFHGLLFRDADASGRIAWDISPEPHFPLRIEMGGRFRPYPGGESFGQP